jgi:sec-independent protein translocase protein TatB
VFDIGFSELIVIGIVALVVVGPERLPKLARTAGHLLGRLQRYANQVKSDIKKEMATEELQKMKTDLEKAAKGAEFEIRETGKSAERLAQAMAVTEIKPGDLDKKEAASEKQEASSALDAGQKPEETAAKPDNPA